jgi:KaiC/GvpD/RAD55 family RecA-like ATPase
VRLVTGIGGLGKTTLSYRFAEEVIKTGAGEIEWVIWLTAKQRTFSALRGQLVPTRHVDFVDLASLYSAILKALSHELPLEEEEEATLDQLADRVVDALQNYTCLIIVGLQGIEWVILRDHNGGNACG